MEKFPRKIEFDSATYLHGIEVVPASVADAQGLQTQYGGTKSVDLSLEAHPQHAVHQLS